MENIIVRVEKIKLENFKNVGKGIIDFKTNLKNSENYVPKSEVIGLYGQNGSGKTALVNAFYFFKCALSQEELPKDAYNYIKLDEDKAILTFEFYIDTKNDKFLVEYELIIEKTEEKTAKITNEKLSYSKKENESWSSKTTIIDYNINFEDVVFKPKNKYNEVVIANKENIVNLKVAKKLVTEKNMSFIFNKDTKKIFENSFKCKDYINIISILEDFAKYNLFVIMNNYSGVINANVLMPFSFRLEQEKEITSGDIVVGLSGSSIISKKTYEVLNKIIIQMNMVLKYIVPDMQIELYNYGEQYNDKGEIGVRVELLSIKNNSKLPIKYESEGIKKIISILSALISMYNNASICMVVDELDSGVYEYLLGEILKVIELGGKGQLIFTSHNLRPLEVLDKDSIYFTTTNEDNRYIRFTNVKTNNNLRSLYIRSINLGGQKEELYKETNILEIRRAFRLAGEKYNVI